MKKKPFHLFFILFFALTALCACGESSGKETFTVTFLQSGFSPITRTVVAGKKVENIPETRRDGSGLVIEWNFDADKPITEDLTIETISYTEGLTFAPNMKKDGYTVTTFRGDATRIVVPENFRGVPVTGVGMFAFASNDKITYVKLPESLKTIGERAFYYCIALERVDMPEEAETIEASAFDSCTSLKELKLPAGITEIPVRLAVGNKYSYIEVPEGVTVIGEYAFASEITDIVLPASLEKIDYVGIWKPLERIYYRGDRGTWEEVDISDREYNGFSAASVAKNAEIYFYSETAPTRKGNFWHYVEGKAAIWE